MTVKYYVDATTKRYLGLVTGAPIFKFDTDTGQRFQAGFEDPVAPPNSIEVNEPPPSGSRFHTHDGTGWVEDADRAEREAAAAVDATLGDGGAGGLMFGALLALHNRVLALEGAPAETAAAYRARLIAMLLP